MIYIFLSFFFLHLNSQGGIIVNLFDTIAELDKRDEFLGMMTSAARFSPEGQFGC